MISKWSLLFSLIFLKIAYATPLPIGPTPSLLWSPATYILASGTAITALTYSNRKHWTSHSQEEISTHKPLGSSAKVGDIMGQLLPNGLYMGEQLIFDRPDGYRRAEHMLFATLSASLCVIALKYTVREKRPSSKSKTSFPSGHTAMAFAFASVVGIHHPWYIGIPAYALASFVGISRVNDNKHYIHDVLGGATIGTAFGFGTYYFSGDRYKVDKVSTNNLQILPLVGPKQGGLLFSYNY